MELLHRTYRNLNRLFSAETGFTCGVIASLVTVELLGRRWAATDAHDVLAALALAVLTLVIVHRHRESPLGWVQFLLGKLQRLWGETKGWAIDIGVDLRGVPPLPRGTPALVHGITYGFIGLIAGLVLAIVFLPYDWRSIFISISYLGYIVGLAALWAGLITAIFSAFLHSSALIHDAWVSRFRGDRRRPRWHEGMCLSLFYFGLVLGAMLLPPWIPLVVCGLALSVNLLTTVIPCNTDVFFVWRYRHEDETVRSIPWGRWMVWAFTFRIFILLVLLLVARGSALWHGMDAHSTLPITSWMGLVLTWLGPGALALVVVQMVAGRLRDPARPGRPVVHLGGAAPTEDMKQLNRHFHEQGWRIRKTHGRVKSIDVPVHLSPEDAPPGEAGPNWPLKITAGTLQTPETMDRLLRRHEIQMRRNLMSGLERLFKYAARFKYRRGTGFLVAPHFWFFPGLIRDSQEDEINLEEGTLLTGIIGPPYHRVMPHAVRHHIFQILRAVQIDLIFVEDGVGFRRFCRVLRMLFEVYDIYGGKRRADEIHLQGVPGIRVLIHQFQLGHPFKSEIYPEPDFEDFGRARILHVFKDRGEQEEPLDTPLDITHVPVPSLAV